MTAMKRIIALFAAAVLFFSCGGEKNLSPETLAPKVDKSTQARVLITTDLEVDDMNGLLLSLLYADQYDIAGIVWTAGMFHFSGDGGLHTLGQITPHFRCNAQHCEHRVKTAADLTEYRPVDPTWLDRVLEYYEEDYKFLSQNNPNYPTPEYIRSITKVGNIEFEGDYRFETEGSRFIEQIILDDDMRPLVIQHWGGINTTVRALYSIYERYHGTPEWDAVLAKVVAKVRIGGSGEDYCRADSKIDQMFPGLQNGGYGFGFFSYGSFFSASKNGPRPAAEELQPYLHAPWNLEAFKLNHGKLTSEIWLMAEGRAIYGEPIIYNYGLIDYMDWGESARQGWDPENLKTYPRADYERYSWAFCQFGCAGFIDIGLRNDVNNRGNNHYTIVMWEELAARADWTIMEPKDCNHAPVVTTDARDLTAKAGETVSLSGKATDPDGDKLDACWYVPATACTYKEGKAEGLKVSSESGWKTDFTVPADAKPGDKLVVNLEVRDQAERPMTRFAQFVITVS